MCTRSLKFKLVSVFLIFSFILFYSPNLLVSRAANSGNLIGFIYAEDGTTPVEGAAIRIRNVSSGKIFDSSRSDKAGIVKIEGIDTGLYAMGVVTPEGDFQSDNVLGVRVSENETAKVSISLKRYDKKMETAVKEMIKEQKKTRRALVGRVISYDAKTGMAEVLIVNGFLQREQDIEVKGDTTDFSQDVKVLVAEGTPIKTAFVGETVYLKVARVVKAGDLIYVKGRYLFPFIIGAAVVIAGTVAIAYKFIDLLEVEPEASPFK